MIPNFVNKKMFHLLDIIGTLFFAISGVLTGLNKKLDAFGVFVIAFVTALGVSLLKEQVFPTKILRFVFLNDLLVF